MTLRRHLLSSFLHITCCHRYRPILCLFNPHLLLFDSVLNDFGFLALKVIVLRQILSQRIAAQSLFLGQMFDRPFAGCADVVRQSCLQVDGPVRLCAVESGLVVIDILLDKLVDELGLVAHRGLSNHRIDDLLTFLPVIFAVGVQVGNQRQNVGNIDDVAVEQLQTEIHVVDIFVFDLGLCSVGSAFLLVSRMTDGDVEVFGAEIHVLLLGHDEIGIVRFVLLVDLRLDFPPDNLAESQHEFAFLGFAFQSVDVADVGIFLQKRDPS